MTFEAGHYQTAAIVLALVAAAAFLLAFWRQSKRIGNLEAEREQAAAFARRARAMLAAHPDGLFLWDHATGGIGCSRRLAEMLELPEGTRSRYDDIRACFAETELQKLERAVSLLRAKGTPFDIIVARAGRTYQAVGARAEDADAKPVADMVWLREAPLVLEGGPDRNRSEFDDRHLTALLDALPAPLWIRDGALGVAFANRAAEKSGTPPSNLASKAAAEGKPVDGEATLGGAAMRVTEAPLGLDGRSGTVGYAVPAPPPAAQRPATASAGLDRVLESLETAVCVFDSDGRLDAFNGAYAGLWSLETGWLEGRPTMRDVLERLRDARRLPEVPDFAAFRAEETGRLGADAAGRDMLHLPDGRTIGRRWNPDGRGGLVFAFEDLSGRLDLERSVKSLDAVQRTTLDHLPEGVAVFGQDGRLTLSNPEFVRLWELAPEAVAPGTRAADLVDAMRPLLPTGGDWAAGRDEIAGSLLSRRLDSGRLDLANGRILRYTRIPLPDGASLFSCLDVTDATRVEDALRDRARALAEADRLKSEFIANVSYEIRTPLTTVIGFAEMLDGDYFGQLNERQRQYATGIVDTSRSLMKVVSDIATLASIEAGFEELEMESLDLHALLADAVALVAGRIRRAGVKLEFDCRPDVGRFVGDAARLKQVVFNLLSNAAAFTPRHGTITLTGARVGDEIEISVADTGPGIPKADRERVLRPFERGKGAEAGVGLGLTLVRSFVDLHKGEVEIRSNAARGATIVCRLPVDPMSVPDGADRESGPAPGAEDGRARQ